MFSRIKVAVALAATAFGLVALASPVQAAPPADKAPAPRPVVELSAKDAASMFKVVKKKATAPRMQAQAQDEVCGIYSPIWVVYYAPTATPLFTQTTRIAPCVDGISVTRLQSATFVETLQISSMVSFGPASVEEAEQNPLPSSYYDAFGVQPFTYCAPDVWVCYSLNHVVYSYINGAGVPATDAFFS